MENEIYNSQADLQWYAVWTRSRQEKCAASVLETLGIPHYLPLKQKFINGATAKRRSQSHSLADICLCASISPSAVVWMCSMRQGSSGSSETKRAPCPSQIIRSKTFESFLTRIQYTVLPLLNEGDRVRVLRGPLTGIEGRLVPAILHPASQSLSR